jgi:hypothetical protein
VAFGLSLLVWMAWGFQAVDLPTGVLSSNSIVRVVDTGTAIRFQPRANRRDTGVIFLPGGLVDPDAYAPLMKNIAAYGHSAQLLRLPWRCACVESQVTELFANIKAVIDANRDTRWFLAGHSRGAMLATRFARESQTEIAGLILLGTTHPRDFDLSATPLKVTKLIGTRDGIATPAATRQNAKLLPASTVWVEIEGGNHVQFGYYRHQLLDGTATITRQQQQAAVLKAIRLALLDK